MNILKYLPLAALLAAMPSLGLAQEAEAAAEAAEAAAAVLASGVPTDVVWILNSLLFLVGGLLVFWMAAGFAMLEAGLVRSKNVTMQLMKNVALFSLAAIMYWLIGYKLMYPGEGWTIEGYLGAFGTAVLEPMGITAETASDITKFSVGSDFFFQLMFCATTASIVSGSLAERIKLWPFLTFVIVLTAFIYPIQASWDWGGGFLEAQLGFMDFAGSTLVHSVGGWAALAGAIVLGPRVGKYAADGRVTPMPGSNLALATLGTFILWMGWFGFNGGSQLAMGSIGDMADVSRIFANTNMAAAAGAVTALVLTQVLYKKPDLTLTLNGALAGLVSITAEPLAPTLGLAGLIGAVGGVIVVFSVPMLDRLKIDDVVGAIPVHLFAGIWCTLAVLLTGGYTGGATFVGQITGILVIGGFVLVTSGVVWIILKATLGLRVDEEAELRGLDTTELGMEAYPDFTKG